MGGGVFSQNPEHPVGIVDARNNRAVSNITSLRVDFGLSKQVFKEMRLAEFFFCLFLLLLLLLKRVAEGYVAKGTRSGTDRWLP